MAIDADLDAAVKVAELLVFAGGIAAGLYRMGTMTARFEVIGKQQANEIGELKTTTKELIKSQARIEELVVSRAVQTQRLDNLDQRLNVVDRKLDTLLGQKV